MESLRKEIDNILDDAFVLSDNKATVMTAYFLEAIAKMLYVQTFHEEFKRDYDRTPFNRNEGKKVVTKSTNI